MELVSTTARISYGAHDGVPATTVTCPSGKLAISTAVLGNVIYGDMEGVPGVVNVQGLGTNSVTFDVMGGMGNTDPYEQATIGVLCATGTTA